MAGPDWRSVPTPNLEALWSVSQKMSVDPYPLIEEIFPNAELSVQQLSAEYEQLSEVLQRRYYSCRLNHPVFWALEQGTFLIYAIVRLARPEVVVETGVANGHSTFFMIHALMRNNKGTLHSIDITHDAGRLLTEDEKRVWTLHVLDLNDKKQSLTGIMNELPQVDLFMHDSDHSYEWQMFEYKAVTSKLSPEAWVATDDADWSFAFCDYCQSMAKRPYFLVGSRTVFGIVPVQQR